MRKDNNVILLIIIELNSDKRLALAYLVYNKSTLCLSINQLLSTQSLRPRGYTSHKVGQKISFE